MVVFTMRLLKLLPLIMLLGVSAQAQSPTYGVGRTPTAEEIRAWDIAISPTGEELPEGSGTADQAPRLVKRDVGVLEDPWNYGRILPIRAPYATTVWDFINRAMPLNAEGTLSADEVYSITAYLLYLNDVIEDDLMVLDEESLPKIEMPNRENWAQVPDWFPGQPRLEGYPY